MFDVRKDHWIVWRVTKALQEATREPVRMLWLDKALYLVCKDFRDRYGAKLLDGNFIVYFYGPYYEELEKLLCEAEQLGLIEYEVEVYLPETPSPEVVDIDYAVQVAESQLKEIIRTYYEKRISVKKDFVEVPEDLKQLLENIHANIEKLEDIIVRNARAVSNARRLEDLLSLVRSDISGRRVGEIVL